MPNQKQSIKKDLFLIHINCRKMESNNRYTIFNFYIKLTQIL